MRQFILYTLLLFSITATLFSCSKDSDQDIVPTNIANITATSLPGNIRLKWDIPTDSNYRYVKVCYYDFLSKKNVVRLASIYSDTLLIPNTRAKFGTYTFTVQPFSKSDIGGEIKTITATSNAAPQIITKTPEPIILTKEMISSNAPEASGDFLENILDGKFDTFFHSSWTEDIPGPHNWQVDLKEEHTSFKFYFANRKNSANKPSNILIEGSIDGTNWNAITTIEKGLPTASGSEYNSDIFTADKPFKKLRFSVTKTNTNTVYFSISEFKLWNVIINIIDPEKE